MRVLVVDDSSDRMPLVESVCVEFGERASATRAVSVYEALTLMAQSFFDILLVDIQIPDRAGEAASINGGISLIERLELDSSLKRPAHIIGITVHHDSYAACYKDFLKRGWTLSLDEGDPGLIANILRSRLSYVEAPIEVFDVAVITALRHTEFQAVLSSTDEWIPIKIKNDASVYHATKLSLRHGGEISIVSSFCHHMGIASAATLTSKMAKAFQPSVFLMVGIAAGIKDRVDIGDVLIVDPCWDWGSGKITIIDDEITFLSSPHQIGISPSLRSELLAKAADGAYLDEIYRSWNGGDKPPRAPNAIVGPVATGSLVLESEQILKTIRKQNRNTNGVDMEAYGFMYALQYGLDPPPRFAVIKAVCDFADPEKNDNWQRYAAYVSWEYARRLLVEGVITVKC